MSSETGYLAKPSADCCIQGAIHHGEPRGTFITIADAETYVSEPSEERANGHVLLYFPDVWGMFPNGLLVMDGFSDAGYLVVGLDYFRGDPVWKHRKSRHDESNPDFDYEAWKKKHTTYADAKVPEWVEAVKEKYGKADTRYACVGYCFGAPYVCDELASSGSCTAGAFAHPAFLKDRHFQQLKKPLYLSCSEIDHTFPTESRNRAIDILQGQHSTYQLQLFSGVEHGFALRGNMENPYERWVKEQSLNGIVKWFDLWLSR